jgi:rod shape-determining protein MreD
MKRLAVLFLVLLLSIIFQVTISPRLSLFGAGIDLILVVSFAIAFISDPESGAVYGFFGGLAIDLMGGIPGLSALSNTLSSYSAGVLERNLKVQERILITFLFGAMIILRQFVYGLSLFLAGIEPSFPALPTLLTSVLINSAVFFMLYPWVNKIYSEKSSLIIGSVIGKRTGDLKSKGF